MTQRKSKRPNNLHLLSGEQQQEFARFQKDLKTAMPHMIDMAQHAKRLHQAMIDAPLWRVVDTPKPDEIEEPKPWSVGHAKVNYVDHIEHEGAEEK